MLPFFLVFRRLSSITNAIFFSSNVSTDFASFVYLCVREKSYTLFCAVCRAVHQTKKQHLTFFTHSLRKCCKIEQIKIHALVRF